MFVVISWGQRRPSRVPDLQLKGKMDSLMEDRGQSGGEGLFEQKELDSLSKIQQQHVVCGLIKAPPRTE